MYIFPSKIFNHQESKEVISRKPFATDVIAEWPRRMHRKRVLFRAVLCVNQMIHIFFVNSFTIHELEGPITSESDEHAEYDDCV